MPLKHTSLRKIMDITNAGTYVNKATATNSFISNSLNIEEFSENKVYEKGSRVYRGDTLNGNPIIYVCIEKTSGYFDSNKWKKDGLLETISTYVTENNELINQRNSFQSHSGFLNKISQIKANKNGKNELYFTDNENINIDGNIIKIPKNTKINLSDPPKTGSREDLVILEYWKSDKDIGQPFYENGMYGGKVIGHASYQQTTFEWRIRSIDGVTFDNGKSQEYNLGEGLGRYSIITAKGPKFNPVEDDGENGIISRFWSVFDRNESTIKGKHTKCFNDRGVYVAGDGSKESINKLETSDGYIIAIPLLKIRRYNNKNFSETNILGAPNRKSLNLPSTDLELAEGISYLTIEPLSDINALEVGEVYEDSNFLLKVSEVNIENNNVKLVVTVNSSSISYSKNHTGTVSISDNYIIKTTNCFGRYADIIQDNDIIDDFRHIIYLGGTDYNYLRESSFDQFMRSETINTEYSWAQYGLEPVFEKYKDIRDNIFPVSTVNKNGKNIKLKNLLGPKSIVTSKTWPNKIRSVKLETITPIKLLIGLNITSNNTSDTKLIEVKPKTGSNTTFNILNKDGWNFFVFEVGIGYENVIDIVIGSFNHTCTINDGFLYEIDDNTYNSYKTTISGGNQLDENVLNTYPLTYSNYKTIKNHISNIVEKDKGFITDPSGNITGIGGKDGSKIYKIKISNKLDDSWLKVLYGDDVTCIGFYSSLLDENVAPVSYINEKSSNETLNSFKIHRTLGNGTKINYMIIETETNNENISIVDLDVPDDIRPIPSGYWYVPENFYNKKFEVRTNDWINDVEQQIYSQSQVSQKMVELISPTIGADSPFISITQTSKGIWSVGDKIKIILNEGVIGGTDLLFEENEEETESGTSSTVKQENIDWIGYDDLDSIDNNKSSGEEFASSAVPVILTSGVTGTWEGIGKNEAILTITEVTSPSVEIKIVYSANYPTGQGMQDMIHFPYVVEVNKQSLRNLEHGPIISMNFKNAWYNSSAHTFIFDRSLMGKISYSTIESTESVTASILDTSWGTEASGTYEKTYHSNTGMKIQMGSAAADKRVIVKVTFNLEEYLKMKYCSTISDFNFNGMELELDLTTIQPSANTINIYASRNRTEDDPSGDTPIIEKIESNFVCDNSGIKKIFLNKHFITDKYVNLIFETTENSDGIVDHSITIKHLSVSMWITTKDLTPTITEPIMRWDYRLFKEGEQLLPPFESQHWVSTYKEVAKSGRYQGPNIKLENFLFIEEPEEFTLSVKDFSNAIIKVGYKNLLNDSSFTEIASITTGQTSISFLSKPFRVLNIYIEAINSGENIVINDIMLTRGKSVTFTEYKSNGLAFYELDNFEVYEQSKLDDGSLPEKTTNFGEIKDKSSLVNATYSPVNSVSLVQLNGIIKYYRVSLKELGISYRELMLQNSKLTISFDFINGNDPQSTATNYLELFIATKDSSGTITWTTLKSLKASSTSTHSDVELNIGTKKNDLYVDEDLGIYIAFENSINRTDTSSNVYINLLNIKFKLSLNQHICKFRTNSIKFGNILRANKTVYLAFTKKSFMSGVLDTVRVFYTHKPTIPSEIKGKKSLSILSESDGFLASDYGTCVGDLNMQHHYNSPLYRVNLDKDTTLGEVGFLKIPFRAGYENINTGTNITILENGDNIGFSPQVCENITDKPIVGIASYLVNVSGEIRLAIARHYSSVGNVKVTGIDPKYIFPIKGRPLIKDVATNIREIVSIPSDSSNETSTGEIIISGIKGYKNSKGYLITFYR